MGFRYFIGSTLQTNTQGEAHKNSSPAGNRSLVSSVTDGDTYQYTTEDNFSTTPRINELKKNVYTCLIIKRDFLLSQPGMACASSICCEWNNKANCSCSGWWYFLPLAVGLPSSSTAGKSPQGPPRLVTATHGQKGSNPGGKTAPDKRVMEDSTSTSKNPLRRKKGVTHARAPNWLFVFVSSTDYSCNKRAGYRTWIIRFDLNLAGLL